MKDIIVVHIVTLYWHSAPEIKKWQKSDMGVSYMQSVDTKSLSTLGLYKDQLRTQILKNKYQLGTKSDSKKED